MKAAMAAMRLSLHFQAIRQVCEEERCPVLSQYICPSHNTFGPFQLVGGTGKGHPDQKDLDAFLAFYQAL